MNCYFRMFSDVPCSGRVDRCHLIPKQRLRQLGFLPDVIWDPKVWVWGCRAHHHRFDMRIVRLERHQLPPQVEGYAREHGIGWSLDRDYGERLAA